MKRHLFVIGLFLLAVLLMQMSLTVQASPAAQLPQYSTPTPGADGRIIYIVKEGDNCIRVALLNGISTETLRSYNPGLDENCVLQVNQQLMIGLAGPAGATQTAGPSPTPTVALPTPTPFNGTTQVCVLLFDDVNGDSLRQDTEVGLAGGEVSVTNVNGSYSKTQTTVSQVDADTGLPVSVCFTDVPEGKYNVSMAIPDGYNPTMDLNYTLDVKAGDQAFVDFGAQSKQNTTTPADGGGSGGFRSVVMGILGSILLLGGGGLGWYAYRMRQPKSSVLGREYPGLKKK